MPTNSERSVTGAIVEAEVSASLQAICKKRGMTQLAVLSRLVRWVAKQEDKIQHEVLHTDPTKESIETSRRLLRYIASKQIIPED
jgi:hypothetical protein